MKNINKGWSEVFNKRDKVEEEFQLAHGCCLFHDLQEYIEFEDIDEESIEDTEFDQKD